MPDSPNRDKKERLGGFRKDPKTVPGKVTNGEGGKETTSFKALSGSYLKHRLKGKEGPKNRSMATTQGATFKTEGQEERGWRENTSYSGDLREYNFCPGEKKTSKSHR